MGFLLNHGNGKPQTAMELLANAEKMVDGQFPDDPLTRARLQLMVGIQYGEATQAEKSMAGQGCRRDPREQSPAGLLGPGS